MSDIAKQKDGKEKKTISDVANFILVKYGKVLLFLIVFLIAAAIVFGIVSTVAASARKKGFAALDEFSYSVVETRKSLSGDELAAKEKELVAEILEFAGKNKSNAVGSRAYLLAADMEFQNKNWEAARSAYVSAAAHKGYTSAVTWYNAAVCSDELNDFDRAAEYYAKAAEDESFPLKTRAMFNLGRVYEAKESYADAAAQYKKLCDENPADPWADIAMTRFLSLQADGKSE